jgi:hypothetical protein
MTMSEFTYPDPTIVGTGRPSLLRKEDGEKAVDCAIPSLGKVEEGV